MAARYEELSDQKLEEVYSFILSKKKEVTMEKHIKFAFEITYSHLGEIHQSVLFYQLIKKELPFAIIPIKDGKMIIYSSIEREAIDLQDELYQSFSIIKTPIERFSLGVEDQRITRL